MTDQLITPVIPPAAGPAGGWLGMAGGPTRLAAAAICALATATAAVCKSMRRIQAAGSDRSKVLVASPGTYARWRRRPLRTRLCWRYE